MYENLVNDYIESKCNAEVGLYRQSRCRVTVAVENYILVYISKCLFVNSVFFVNLAILM
jgi:hypothetical protein